MKTTAGTKYAGDPVGQPLNRRAAALGFPNHPDNLRQQCFPADAVGAENDRRRSR